MDELLTLNFILLALGAYAVVFVLRKVIDRYCDVHGAWRELVLPILPVPVGAAVAFAAHQSVLLGLVAGLCASKVYRLAKSAIRSKSAA